MKSDPSRLVHHLAAAIVLKLAVLMLLWWFFVRDAQVPVDAEQTAAHIGATPPTQGATR
jgi:hypothetical protein